jgi:hypothetical protein
MFTLIKREITDHIPHLLLAAVLAATMIGVLLYTAYAELAGAAGGLLPLGVIALTGCCFMGIAQAYDDRVNKISPFLATLAVTRTQILMARCITGVITILIVLVPTLIAAVVLLRQFLPPLVFYWRAMVEVTATLFLLALASYGLGLLIGSSTRKLLLAAGCLLIPSLMTALIVVKGFGPQVMAVLIVLILATFARVLTKLSATPL